MRASWIMPLGAAAFSLLWSPFAWGQTQPSPPTGTVTYVTSENVYVRFASTAMIEMGDTLRKGGEPCLVVQQKSSTSCVTAPLPGCDPLVGEEMVASTRAQMPMDKVASAPTDVAISEEVPDDAPPSAGGTDVATTRHPMRVRGSISATTFATSALRANKATLSSARAAMRLQLNAENLFLLGRPLELAFAGNFQQIYRDPSASLPGWRQRNALYQAGLSYRFAQGVVLHAGRRLARGFSTLGALDGGQVEWQRSGWSAGVLAGFEPNLINNGLDLSRPVAGVQFGRRLRLDDRSSDWRLGFLGQRYNRDADRRFLFGQYSLRLGRNWKFFGSGEWDVYATAGYARKGPRALFGSASWQFAPKWSAYLSVDKRAPIMRFSTFESSTLQSLMERSAQYVCRIRLSGALGEHHRFTAGASDRWEESSLGRTYQFRYTWSELPGIGGRLGYSAFRTQMPRLTTASQRLSYDVPIGSRSGRLSVHYRWVRSVFDHAALASVDQHYWGGSVRGKLGDAWQVTFAVESATQQYQNVLRLQTGLTYRFLHTNEESETP